MSSLSISGIDGKGPIGVLVAGILASKVLNLGVSDILGFVLIVFVLAGAVSLILRSI